MVTSIALVFLWVTGVINALSAKGQTLINFNGKWAVIPVVFCIFCARNCLHNNAQGLALITCAGRCINSGTGSSPVAIKLCKLKCFIWRHEKPSIWLGDTPLFLVQLLTCSFFPHLVIWSCYRFFCEETPSQLAVKMGKVGGKAPKSIPILPHWNFWCCQSKAKPKKNVSNRRLFLDFVFHPQERLYLHFSCLSLFKISVLSVVFQGCTLNVSFKAHWEENETAKLYSPHGTIWSPCCGNKFLLKC